MSLAKFKDTTARRVWTLVILGGDPFTIRVPRHPALEHDGQKTVWKFDGTEHQMEQLAAYIRADCGASVEGYTDGFTR